MPQTITIAAFVFGAVLLLIALLGGGFKIFGAEVPEKVGRTARVVAAVAGIVFIGIGLFDSFPTQGPKGNIPKEESSKPHSATQPTPPPPVPRPPKIIGFDASKPSINLGDSVTLSWRVNEAEEVKLDGQKVDHSDTKVVSPDATKTYQLMAYNKDGSDQKDLTVYVVKLGPPPDNKETDFTKRALDAPKNNTWYGDLVIFNPQSGEDLAKGKLIFGPTSFENRIAFARISFDQSSFTGFRDHVEATEAVWGFMGGQTDSSVSITFGKNPQNPVLIFNKLTKDYNNGFLELRGVLLMQQQSKYETIGQARASCRAR
jgi:hypothetical protein